MAAVIDGSSWEYLIGIGIDFPDDESDVENIEENSKYDVVLHQTDLDGFGFLLVTSDSVKGAIIGQVYKNSPADQSGKLKLGDRVIAINGADIQSMEHEEIVDFIGNCDQTVQLTIIPDDDEDDKEDEEPLLDKSAQIDRTGGKLQGFEEVQLPSTQLSSTSYETSVSMFQRRITDIFDKIIVFFLLLVLIFSLYGACLNFLSTSATSPERVVLDIEHTGPLKRGDLGVFKMPNEKLIRRVMEVAVISEMAGKKAYITQAVSCENCGSYLSETISFHEAKMIGRAELIRSSLEPSVCHFFAVLFTICALICAVLRTWIDNFNPPAHTRTEN